jgi:hypothetical protein
MAVSYSIKMDEKVDLSIATLCIAHISCYLGSHAGEYQAYLSESVHHSGRYRGWNLACVQIHFRSIDMA